MADPESISRDFVHLHTIAEQTQRLERINDDLRQANALKTELIGIAAHDLREPVLGLWR